LVLVVEDDEDTRFLYMAELANMGYRVAGEWDGARGVEAAVRLRPTAILIDVGLPVLNGIEATRRIKEDPRTSQCLVIVMTGNAMKLEEARAAGCEAFFCKPFEPAALHEVLRTLLSPLEQARIHVRPEMVKECTCGRQFSLQQWLELPACGRMHVPQRGVVVELRTCLACGSSLTVELDDVGVPLARIAPAPNSSREVARTARATILVVDRDPHVRRLAQQLLGEMCDLEFADDGYAALDRVRASLPSAVITEILIPRLDGLALCRALKGDSATQRVPILVISMLAANERARQSGADAFLEKPLERTGLVTAVCALLEPKEAEAEAGRSEHAEQRGGALPPQEKSTSCA
jgi:CheY-like chemotaxis protein